MLNKDQASIALSRAYASTVDNTGEEYVYDAVGNENDFRRLCTLNLVIPKKTNKTKLKVEDDLSNLPKPGVVFSANSFMTEDYWHEQEDAALWDDHVLVSFQENSWVDSSTYQHHIQ